MDVQPENEKIRKIEDVIDLQIAKDSIDNSKQVVFKIPSHTNNLTANIVRSLESGLSENIRWRKKKHNKQVKRRKILLPDLISWPSDSDITVLRMKLCLNKNELKDNVGNLVPGDGLHQPDSSSMVNLATLMLKSQSPSKHSVNIEEYLLPITSWEEGHDLEPKLKEIEPNSEEEKGQDYVTQLDGDVGVHGSTCSHGLFTGSVAEASRDVTREMSAKSKVARFLRLYFCPCCTCLYEMEKMCDKQSPSYYFSNQVELRKSVEC